MLRTAQILCPKCGGIERIFLWRNSIKQHRIPVTSSPAVLSFPYLIYVYHFGISRTLNSYKIEMTKKNGMNLMIVRGSERCWGSHKKQQIPVKMSSEVRFEIMHQNLDCYGPINVTTVRSKAIRKTVDEGSAVRQYGHQRMAISSARDRCPGTHRCQKYNESLLCLQLTQFQFRKSQIGVCKNVYNTSICLFFIFNGTAH